MALSVGFAVGRLVTLAVLATVLVPVSELIPVTAIRMLVAKSVVPATTCFAIIPAITEAFAEALAVTRVASFQTPVVLPIMVTATIHVVMFVMTIHVMMVHILTVHIMMVIVVAGRSILGNGGGGQQRHAKKSD
jgi:hypothetical protein